MPVPEIEKLLRQSSAELDVVQLIKKIEVVDQGTPGSSSTIGVTHLSHGNGHAAALVTASITPAANTLILFSLTHSYDASGYPTVDPSNVAGCGLTWVKVGVSTRQNQFGDYIRTVIYRAMGSAPTSGAITCSMIGNDTCWAYSIDQFSNVDTSGTGGSGAIRQFATGIDSSGPLTVTLAAFGNANNIAFGAMGAIRGAATSYTIGVLNSMTALAYNQSPNTPMAGLLTEWKLNDPSVQATVFGANQYMAGVAVEIVAGPAGSDTAGTPVDFLDIPQTFSALKLIGFARGTAVATADTAWMKINGDTGAYYDYQYDTGAGAAASAGEVFATPNGIPLANIAGANAAANVFGGFEATIFGYAGATDKSVLSKSSGGNRTTGTLLSVEWAGFWRNTAPITRITLNSNLFFLVGSTFWLYGIK